MIRRGECVQCICYNFRLSQYFSNIYYFDQNTNSIQVQAISTYL